eukprot:m.237714 g.237714  ORF g.237714 m.237714 type:complete len:100 (+) comp54335_c0_seq4:2141-2440(+)
MLKPTSNARLKLISGLFLFFVCPGLSIVPHHFVNPRNLRDYCDGCVIDRATAPADLLADLERMADPGFYDSNIPPARRQDRSSDSAADYSAKRPRHDYP